jgi:hypothetical protein
MRLFLKFGWPDSDTDHYARLNAKLRKKLKQTKISDHHLGKIVLIEVPFNLRTIDERKLKHAVHDAAKHSKRALAVILANREGNPQMRNHYSQSGTFNETALRAGQAEIVAAVDLLNRTFQNELRLDPILEVPYRRDWAAAQARATRISERIAE